jgi:hypothetical protein
VDTLRQEKAKVVAACETEVAAIHSKFQDYRVKLHEFWANMEGAMNEIGV